MGRKITSDMFPGGTDERVLRRGDDVDMRIVSDILGLYEAEIDEDEGIIQNRKPFTEHFIGQTQLFHTFCRADENEPYHYAGLCAGGECGNMHPRASQMVFIISQFHAEDAAGLDFNARFARSLARNEFLKTADIPVLPHLYFPSFMLDSGFERDFGIEAGHILMDRCDRVILAVIDGNISQGMRADIDYAVSRLGLRPERLDFTRDQAEEYVRETEEAAHGNRDGCQH